MVVTNSGASELVVSGVRLRADHFAVVPGEAKSARLAPGARVALQADFGAVDCDGPDPVDAAAELVLARHGDPVPTTLLVRLDPAPLDEIRDLECGQQRVADAVAITFSPPSTVDDLHLSTELVLTRRSGTEPVTVRSVRGSVLISLAATEPTPVTMGSGEEERRVPVVFSAIRCDPHAVGQATKPLDVVLFVAVGDDPPQYVAPVLDDRLAAELRGLIARCVRARPPEG